MLETGTASLLLPNFSFSKVGNMVKDSYVTVGLSNSHSRMGSHLGRLEQRLRSRFSVSSGRSVV